jgi:MFS family permease
MFLKEIGIDQLPYVYILIALVVGVISSGYSRAAARVSLSTLIRTTSLIAIANLFLFWLSLHRTGAWMFYVLYIWVSVFGVITASQFWLLANYVFNPREAKRLFALVGAGGVLGGIIGGAFTRYGAHWFGTENLLLWCMGFMGLTILILEPVSREASVAPNSIPSDAESQVEQSERATCSAHRFAPFDDADHHSRDYDYRILVDYQVKFLSDMLSLADQLIVLGMLLSRIASCCSDLYSTDLKRFGVGASILFCRPDLCGSIVSRSFPSMGGWVSEDQRWRLSLLDSSLGNRVAIFAGADVRQEPGEGLHRPVH